MKLKSSALLIAAAFAFCSPQLADAKSKTPTNVFERYIAVQMR